MCLITDAKGNVRVHCGWVFEDSFVENMCPWPDDHSKWLVVNFEGEDVLNYGGVSREWFFFLKHTIYSIRANASRYTTYTTDRPGPGAHFVPGFSKMVLNRETNPKDLEVVNHRRTKTLHGC